jgi:TonB family protein
LKEKISGRIKMRNEKILVVEFEENSLNSLLQLLENEGFEVVTAKDGHEGLLKFESENPDLVILEPMLLKLHGFDLCRKITKDSPKKTPVVITTGFYKGEHYKAEAIETFGASAFFEKPYQNEELLTTIHDLLGNGTGEPAEEVLKSIQEPEVSVKDEERNAEEMGKSLEELKMTPDKEQEHEEITSEEISEGDEVSREVDAMLKNALSEFGLSLDKRKVEAEKTEKKAGKEKPPEEDLTKAEMESPETEQVGVMEEVSEEEEVEEEEELKTEEIIEELIRKEEKGKDVDKPEEEMVLAEAEELKGSEGELRSEEVREELREEIEVKVEEEIKEEAKEGVQETVQEEITHEEIKEEEQDPDKKVFEEYFEQPEKVPFHMNLLGFLKRIKKPIPIMIGSSAFIILVAAGATYYFLKPNKVSTPLKKENSKIVSDIQRTSPSSPDEDFASENPGNQEGTEQKITPVSATPEGSDRDTSQTLASNEALPDVEPEKESTTEFAAPTRLSSRQRQVMLPSVSEAPGSRNFEVIEVEETKEARVETSELAVSLPQLEETAKKIIQPEDASDRIKTGDLIPIDSVDVLPVAVSKVNPTYPLSAFRRGIEATVEFRVLISEFGNVLDVAFVDSGRSLSVFHKACDEAARQWKFSPAKKDGLNVKVWKTFSIAFKKKNME